MRRCRRMFAYACALMACGSATATLGQEQEISCEAVPALVREGFAATYPKATIETCAQEVQEGETVYEFSSTEGETGLDVIFDSQGKLVVEERTIAAGEVPAMVMDAVHRKFPGGEVTLVEKVTEGAAVRYEFRLTNQGKPEVIELDGDGNEVKP